MFKILRFITIIFAKFYATRVGEDEFGNVYFEHNSKVTGFGLKKRFCIYNGLPESSRVPSVFHSWLHYSSDDISLIKTLPRYKWFKKHTPNLTGTNIATTYKNTQARYYKSWKPAKS